VKVAIRDDDTCYFTAPEDLERVYGGVWEAAPVCLATVPFAVGYERVGIPERHWQGGEPFALERNAPLVAYIKELVARGRATVALHGYTHEDYANGYEFQAAPDPLRRIREGRRYLQAQLGAAISIFVPPHNALSRRALDAVSRERLNLLGSFISFRPSLRRWDVRTPSNWWRVRRYRARTGRTRSSSFVYPHVLRYARHAEFGCHALVPGTTIDALTAAFDEARDAGGDFCVATHYWEVDERLGGVLRTFLDYASRFSDVRFVVAEALFA
jgi:predicted deacetylase